MYKYYLAFAFLLAIALVLFGQAEYVNAADMEADMEGQKIASQNSTGTSEIQNSMGPSDSQNSMGPSDTQNSKTK